MGFLYPFEATTLSSSNIYEDCPSFSATVKKKKTFVLNQVTPAHRWYINKSVKHFKSKMEQPQPKPKPQYNS